jgi:hypothetical protein
LDVLAAAAGEHGIDLNIVFFVKALCLSNVNRQRDGKQDAMRHDDDDFGARAGGPSGWGYSEYDA